MVEAKANLDQLVAEKAYEVITAPFDGVVTARYADPGQLIPWNTAPRTATPVIAMAGLSPLRVYIDTPQSLAPFIRNGTPAPSRSANFRAANSRAASRAIRAP